VKLKLRDKQIEVDRGEVTDVDPRMTVKAWAAEYLELRKQPPKALSPNGWNAAASPIRKWIVPTIGHKRLADLTPKDRRKVAQAQFDRALELDPTNPALLRRYAWVLMMMGRLKSAKIYARKAVKLRPNSRENSLLLARIYIEEHEYLKAIEILKPFSRHRQVEKVLEICKSRLALSYEGAVFQMLLKGMVCDEQPFTLNDLKKAQNLWSETLREIPVRSLIGHLPSSWSAALAWLVLQEREKESYFTMDDVAVRFGSATQDIWPCVLRLQEVSSDEGQCRSNR
jgi:tetratricopeptide (TPR) repeat protein